MTIALTSATGKLGGAVLSAILENNLIDTKELVVCTSSDPKDSRFDVLRSQNIVLRQANFDDSSSLKEAYSGCDKVFLVSTPRIEMDYNDAPLWHGREKHHRAAIDAALEVGVKHIYYTSLGFSNPSKAGVMRAHIRTEAYLHDLEKDGKTKVTIIREGLYNESWPLYFGYYFGLKGETRKEVVVAGDGPISWTSISDMAYGTAKVLTAPSEQWSGKTFYLSQKRTWTLQDVAGIVSKVKGEEVRLKVVSREDYENFYAERGTERASVEWWSSSYDALKDGECAIDDPTLERLLKETGRSPESLEATIERMLK
ncbi:NmrA-like family protein [Stagonosporopsis vannaccii]|nr:NmrA-like family protein [Stagonosporopsis vannaccii]